MEKNSAFHNSVKTQIKSWDLFIEGRQIYTRFIFEIPQFIPKIRIKPDFRKQKNKTGNLLPYSNYLLCCFRREQYLESSSLILLALNIHLAIMAFDDFEANHQSEAVSVFLCRIEWLADFL
jgi:hypothetical protein